MGRAARGALPARGHRVRGRVAPPHLLEARVPGRRDPVHRDVVPAVARVQQAPGLGGRERSLLQGRQARGSRSTSTSAASARRRQKRGTAICLGLAKLLDDHLKDDDTRQVSGLKDVPHKAFTSAFGSPSLDGLRVTPDGRCTIVYCLDAQETLDKLTRLHRPRAGPPDPRPVPGKRGRGLVRAAARCVAGPPPLRPDAAPRVAGGGVPSQVLGPGLRLQRPRGTPEQSREGARGFLPRRVASEEPGVGERPPQDRLPPRAHLEPQDRQQHGRFREGLPLHVGERTARSMQPSTRPADP